MTQKEQARGKVLTMVIEGRCTAREAGELLGLSNRHVLRLKKGLREQGPGALAHGNRGRKPSHAIKEVLREEVLRLAGSYQGYNHTHLQEVLQEEHSITISRRSVARILTTAGLRSPRRRRSRRHRSRREPSPRAGMLLQVDGSQHDWLEGRGPRLVLIGGVDDATGELVHGLFREQEDAQGYLTLLRDSVRKKGLPLAWYSDRHGIFSRNDKQQWTLAEELAGRREPTQVGRALNQLGINLILARSPQAKGRVERCWGTLQDRLVKELRKAQAATLTEANAVLKRYLPVYRKRFARQAADPVPAYRALPKNIDLAGVCSFHYVRTVANDNTVRLEDRLAHIPPGPGGRSYAGCRVQVQERLDGSLAVVYQGRLLVRVPGSAQRTLRNRHRKHGQDLPKEPSQPAQRAQKKEANTKTLKPRDNHPWRTLMFAASQTHGDKFTGQLR